MPLSSSPQRKSLFFSLRCGCRDSKSVSVSPNPKAPLKPPDPKPVTPTTDTIFSSETLTSSFDGGSAASRDSSSSFSGLLRQLNDLEQSVLAWNARPQRSDGGRVRESVAVVKDSDDPLADFRRSMLQMIVEKEIVGAEELKELLGRFLALNEAEHHAVIVRAFEEIWSELFSGYYENAPDFLTELRKPDP